MKSLKKIMIAGASALALATVASVNSQSVSAASTKPKGNITLWVDTNNVPSYKKLVKQFEKKYPKVKVKVSTSPSGSASAKTDLAKDPSKAADVFKAPNDQLGAMYNAGYINPLSPSATKWVKKNDVKLAGKAVTWKGQYLAYPQDVQSNIIYYDKSKLSADEVSSWSTLTSKGVIGTDFTNAYNWYPAFLSNGTNLYGKSGEKINGTKVNNEKGVEVMTWLAAQKNNKGVRQSGSALLSDLENGKTQAILDGPWDGQSVKKILGDNFGVTILPKLNFESGDKQMKAFSGVGTLAVNAKSKNQLAAATLAQYLSNKSSQVALYKGTNAIPVSKKAQKNKAVKADPVAKAVIKQANFSVVMPKMNQMATFWNLAAPLVDNAYTGKTKPADYKTQLASFEKQISKDSK